MGPAKGSRTITKITIKGYEDRQHEDPTSSGKVKIKKRKMSDLGPQWSKDELICFYEAYRRHGKNWKKISAAVGGKSTELVEALYSAHRTFLSLPEREGTAMGFVALVTGHHNVLEEPTSHKESDQTVRAYGRTQKRGEATEQKENEVPHARRSYHERTSGFSSFKKRYYGELVKNIPRHPSAKRTPRVPVLVPADMKAAADATPEIENAINSAKKANEDINYEHSIVVMNGCSPDGSSGISESTKAVRVQPFLEPKGTGDSQISQNPRCLKKRRMEQSMDQSQTSKDEHESTMVAKEENGLAEDQNLADIFSPDEMLVLDVLESLVSVPSKTSQPKISIPSAGKNNSQRGEEGPNSVERSKQRKKIGECSASKARNKRRKKLIAEVVPAEEPNISNHLVLPEERQIDAAERPLNPNPERGTVDLPESTANISTEVPALPKQIKHEINISRRSKRKFKRQCGSKNTTCNGADNLQARRLEHCLSSESLRRWCTYEWFYSAVDYPWFMNNEFANYLNFAKLSHLSRLTRSEWSTIRSSLGKPRRFSDHFLAVEKQKLEDYRKNVRQYYAQLSEGLRDSLPADLARPFSIGQQVIVRNRRTRELCNGKVMMIEQDCYKVQFDRPDLGIDIVKDTDCMPVNWSDNLPDDLKRSFLSNKSHNRVEVEQIPRLTSKEKSDHINGVSTSEPSKTMHKASNEQLKDLLDEQLKVEIAVDSERLSNASTSGRCAPLHSLQSVDDTVQSRGWSHHSNGHDDELESYVTSFLQMSLSQAKQMVDDVMQTIPKNGKSSLQETCISNEATNCISPEREAAGDAELPCNLIFNCIATVLAIKHLSETRYPPANTARVLERACLMLHPSCSENLTIYNDIKYYISAIKNQILALVPTSAGNTGLPIM